MITPEGDVAVLERRELGRGFHSEDWLQNQLHDRPSLLPIAQIEPGFGEAIAIAREIPCGHGHIDNFFLTPSGDIILVETKLWVNPEARREVVAQTLDYASALQAMSYEAFEATVKRAQPANLSIYDRVKDHREVLPEAEFIDAVAHNLARGRMLVLIIGDGIRREAERLGAYLQSHAGAHFTFALVEMGVWALGDQLLIVPDVIAQTVMIERGVVTMVGDGAKIIPSTPRPVASTNTSSSPRAKSLTDEMFDEALGHRSPTLPAQLRAFVASLEPLGVYVELGKSMSLRVDLEGYAKAISLGYIVTNGQLWTDNVLIRAPGPASQAYLQTLAAMIGGSVSSTSYAAVKDADGHAPPLAAFLPVHADAWRQAIETYIRELNNRAPN